MPKLTLPARTISIAPMLDWTDRHFRYLARQLSRHCWLYTEMIHAGAIVHGDPNRFLLKDECENPIALQLGGSDPHYLAQAAKKIAQYGYDEINLNCGCPSSRVQKGAFGACLMNHVNLVADCLNSMYEAAPNCAITIKHRIGIDQQNDYQSIRDFVGTLANTTPVRTYIVHARNAWLKGLSPKENRNIPPLKYDYVYRLKKDFPELEIIINGGITQNQQIHEHLHYVDGVMIGREAYHNTIILRDWDTLYYQETTPSISYNELIQRLYNYTKKQLQSNNGTTLRHIVRHYLGLMHGLKRAKTWRHILSNSQLLQQNRPELILEAWKAMNPPFNNIH